MSIELKSLCGLHKLSGVGFKNEDMKSDYGNQYSPRVMIFRLDNKNYKAIEDDNDGYRSSMDSLEITDECPSEIFKAIKVLVRHTTTHEGAYSSDDDNMLEFIDIKTGQIILEVGTENCGDYYPGFVATFHKERLLKESR